MLSTLKVIFLLLFWIWNVEGVKRVMPDKDVSTNFTSDTKVTSDSGSESDQDELPCCTIGDDVFYSLVDALAKATSNDIINITSHVIVLSSIVTIEGLDNFTIIGHINSTTIQCNDIGAVKFVDCNNVTMEGINWERCGSKNKPAIGVYNSSGVAFENCLFIYSKGQAVVLSNISGIAYIKNCNFAHNNEHRSQGAAIYYLSSTAQSMILTDNNRFESNGPANSIVYIGTLNNKYPSHNYLQNSIIVNNCGVPIYISHTTLHLNGSVLFKGNEADNGGGIYSTSSTVTFDNNSNVSFSFNSAATSGGAIYQINSQVLFSGNSNVTFTNNSAANGYGGVFYSNTTSFISFTDHVTVVFINNFASVSAGGIYSSGHSNISFDGNSRVNFNNNSAEQFGGAMTLFGNASVSFGGSSIITFTKNRARVHGGAMYCYGNSIISSHESSTVKFYNNRVADHGGAIQIFDYSHVTFHGNSFAIFTNNTARYGGAVYAYTNSTVSFDDFSITTFIENTANRNGGALVVFSNSNMSIVGNSTITFKKNKATSEGGAVHCNILCNILINDNSNVTFSDNSAVKGGAVGNRDNSKLAIRGRSLLTFTGNTATKGGGGAVYCTTNSIMSFYENSTVKFYNNRAALRGGAIHSFHYSHFTFQGNSCVSFINNTARFGGAIHAHTNSRASFDDFSTITFTENTADENGGALTGVLYSSVSFTGNSTIIFQNNKATNEGGAVHCIFHCNILVDNDSNVTFSDNSVVKGGALDTIDNSKLSIRGRSLVTFTGNTATDGGAVYCTINSIISFHENSTMKFYNNTAVNHGGALSTDSSIVTFQGYAIVSFTNNTAKEGGAIFGFPNNEALFDEYSIITFAENTAKHGGAVSWHLAHMSFQGNSTIIFKKNKATTGFGGAVLCNNNCDLLFDGDTNVTYSGNSAVDGGAVCTSTYSKLSIRSSSRLTFTNNNATFGGAIQCIIQSSIIFDGNALVTITYNTAIRYGGAISVDNSIMKTKGKSNLTIIENSAIYGGAIHTSKSLSITFEDDSVVTLTYNTAKENGGALHLRDNLLTVFNYMSSITFDGNIADRYGGAIYAELSQEVNSIMYFNTIEIYLHNNTAPFGNNIYVHVPSSCDDQCLNNSIIVGSGQRQFVDYISTSPNKLVFFEPAMCIDNDDHTNCETYIVRNIMLGQKIAVNGCVWDYYNKQAAATQFSVSSSDKAHHIAGSEYVLISCDVLQRLSLTGDKVTEAENIPMNFTSHSGSQSDLKTIFEQLIVELSPCHPGFHYDNTTQRCICYSDNDIVSCIDSTSTIKEGYWFGVVDGRTTVAICPNSYCNFSCCKTTNEFYQLSPVRINQCLSHRSGTACGSCDEGYTLSFDSVDCVSVKKCTTGQTSLVVTLSMIYWIVIVILVFIMTYYQAGIGYLYAITYYYSVVDILLGERLYISAGLFTTVSIMSSIAKITPQFLGQLCFVKNLSGIDQQFIHYSHPLAVTIIVGIICLLARVSYRISTFVSRGIIHVICYLLLLSYTSVATTSLLLLRSLTFHNVDKVYSYLSPNIEYFRGRHLPYSIIAILCTLVIVIGLPLLLLLEPFLNRKINFTRIKPLLDQFQGCYKDKYRSFAGYYMTCRLVIILIIIINSSNDNTTHYLLIIVNVTLALIQVTLRPYSSTILNMFDGLILQLLIVVSMIPLIDSFDPDLLLTFTIILVTLPLVAFVMMEIYLYKSKIKKITELFVPPKQDNTNDNDEIPMINYVDTVIDDTSRRNAYICEM